MVTSYMTEDLERALDHLSKTWGGEHDSLDVVEAALIVLAAWRKIERHIPTRYTAENPDPFPGPFYWPFVEGVLEVPDARCPGSEHSKHIGAVCGGDCCTTCGGPIFDSECRCP